MAYWYTVCRFTTINGQPQVDLTPYMQAYANRKNVSWRLVEVGAGGYGTYPYGSGTVDSSGVMSRDTSGLGRINYS